MERRDNTLDYSDVGGSFKQWQENAYWCPFMLVESDWNQIRHTKKVTNPPQLLDYVTRYVTTTYFSEDGTYAQPIELLGEGIVACTQTRSLIGVIADE